MITNPLRDPRDRRLPRVPEPCALVVFGITGDLARKKLLPAVYDLANRGPAATNFALLGFARRDWGDEDFAELARDAARKAARTPWREEVWERLAGSVRFVQGSFDDDNAFDQLAATLGELEGSHGIGGNAAFYLSIPPAMFPVVLKQMQRTGMADNAQSGGWRRVVVEKPFGHDLASAKELNALVDSVFGARTSSGSTTTWARRRSRTCWRCASPTRCSSRSGTPTTSTPCRSPWPRTSASAPAPPSTRRPAPPATCCRTTCCSCSR
jgi:glucose-6-phosphate 1-dehydrogenase